MFDPAVSSKEVFAKRKIGALDEAYEMGVKLVALNNQDEWNIKALSWCLIDLIKREAGNNNLPLVDLYIAELQSLEISASDEILSKHVASAVQLANPNARLIQQAKNFSKSGDHQQAVNLYTQLLQHEPENAELRTSLGWEYYRLAKIQFGAERVNVGAVKQILNYYLQLNAARPSLLHSLILGLGDKLIGESNFNLVAFIKIWGIENLRDDDFKPYVDPSTSNTYSSLAEKVILHTSKQAVEQIDTTMLTALLPLLDKAIFGSADSIWLKMNKAKALSSLGQSSKAFDLALEVTKQKVGDYWAWELLGNIQKNISFENAFSCYCRALSVNPKEDFVGKLRIKLAVMLAEKELYAEAKYEVERVIQVKKEAQQKVSKDALLLQNQVWFTSVDAAKDNQKLYSNNIAIAEALLFSNMPWLDACVGNMFSLKDQPHKKRQIVYVQTDATKEPVEVALPVGRYAFSGIELGAGIKIKGEADSVGRFNVYQIGARSSVKIWDVFPERIAVIDHINTQKQLMHVVIQRGMDAVIPFDKLPKKYSVGETIAVKISRSQTKQGTKFRVVEVKDTAKEASNLIKKTFKESVRVSNGLGFTDSDIFIDRSLVNTHNINDDNVVEGVAVINFNKKHSTWGWKALKISSASQ